MKLEAPAYAKINIGLHIQGRLPDGYHDLETLFYRYEPLYDILALQTQNGLNRCSLEVRGYPVTHENLLHKAYDHLVTLGARLPSLHLRLYKNIPIGAGLGGGSSDVGLFLRMLTQLTPEYTPLIQKVAYQIGSDVAFFFSGEKAALGKGRGDQLLPMCWMPEKEIFLFLPPLASPTAQVYKALEPADWSQTPLLPLLPSWKIQNDLEKPFFRLFPQLRPFKEYLYASGATHVSLSGSGSAFWAIF
ncbi:MAG: 4-(cytidine 5'-diphospho)-2-C-methyl-D-erythritol kinase [Bacteroidia bacterium]